MSTPYNPPDAGSAVLFPVLLHNSDNPDLANAVNALLYNDESRWPEEGGSNVPLKTWVVDSPDANAVANWLGQAQGFLPGATVADPPATDAAGTVPYVNPANSSAPDAVYALNYCLDHLS